MDCGGRLTDSYKCFYKRTHTKRQIIDVNESQQFEKETRSITSHFHFDSFAQIQILQQWQATFRSALLPHVNFSFIFSIFFFTSGIWPTSYEMIRDNKRK